MDFPSAEEAWELLARDGTPACPLEAFMCGEVWVFGVCLKMIDSHQNAFFVGNAWR